MRPLLAYFTKMTPLGARTLTLLTMALLTACGAPVKEQAPESPPDIFTIEPPPPEPVPQPWTKSFQASALLIADEIRIEGPKGLLDHVATRIEPEHHVYEVDTLPAGFQQVFRPRDEAAGFEMRAYLDALEVVAFKRLVLLERPGDAEVVVQAAGDAYWRDASTGQERRGALLRFVGEPPK